jgi:hypothetical protein
MNVLNRMWQFLLGQRLTVRWTVTRERNRRSFAGLFHAHDSQWKRPMLVRGLVHEYPGLPAEVYLFDPPPLLRRHPHGSCLQLVSPSTRLFRLHWTKPPRTFEQSRAFVEQMMWEARMLDAKSRIGTRSDRRQPTGPRSD